MNNMKRATFLAFIATFCILALTVAAKSKMAEGEPRLQKYLVILHAGTESHEGKARVLHALLYAKELKEGGYPVTLIFDGAGTAWAEALRDTKHDFHAQYEAVQKLDIVQIICDECAVAFKVKDKLKDTADANFVREFEGHPSVKKWISQGYQVIVL